MTTATTTARDAYQNVLSQAERIVNSEPQSLATMEPLDEWRQGDVRIIRLPDEFDESLVRQLKDVPRQLAPGTTVGSRHVLDSVDGVTAFELTSANALDGPVLCLTKPRSITHPEHGDCVDLPPGWYAFPGQRSYAEELRRTQD